MANNNAAALVLARRDARRGGTPSGEVVVSRGELVEIGGSFRIPEILAAAGARLVEVGTTNRTRLDDYRRAVGPGDAAAAQGAPQQLPHRRLHRRRRRRRRSRGLGARGGPAAARRRGRRPAAAAARAAARRPRRASASCSPPAPDLVCGSGDKLLGGPQAGLLLGDGASWWRAAAGIRSTARCARAGSPTPRSTACCAGTWRARRCRSTGCGRRPTRTASASPRWRRRSAARWSSPSLRRRRRGARGAHPRRGGGAARRRGRAGAAAPGSRRLERRAAGGRLSARGAAAARPAHRGAGRRCRAGRRGARGARCRRRAHARRRGARAWEANPERDARSRRRSARAGTRLLVVEDRESLRRMLERALGGEGYRVDVAADEAAAATALGGGALRPRAHRPHAARRLGARGGRGLPRARRRRCRWW